MYECDICLAKIKKGNKNKHGKSMKHKNYCSNLIINKYIVKKMNLIILKIFLNRTMSAIKRNLTTLVF